MNSCCKQISARQNQVAAALLQFEHQSRQSQTLPFASVFAPLATAPMTTSSFFRFYRTQETAKGNGGEVAHTAKHRHMHTHAQTHARTHTHARTRTNTHVACTVGTRGANLSDGVRETLLLLLPGACARFSGSGCPYRAICRCDNSDACLPPTLRLLPWLWLLPAVPCCRCDLCPRLWLRLRPPWWLWCLRELATLAGYEREVVATDDA